MGAFNLQLREMLEFTDGDMGLSDYPIFEAGHREILNTKIKRRFFMEEIGQETPEQFIHQMNMRMHEIMPYYNQLYKSELLAFDPLLSMKIKTTSDGTGQQEVENASESAMKSDNVQNGKVTNFATPQTKLSEDEYYATSAAKSENNAGTESESNESANTNASSQEHRESLTEGYQGSASVLLQEFRETIINIDLMIIENLTDLFMGLWNHGDNYYNRGAYQW
jgi:hypothetical protein